MVKRTSPKPDQNVDNQFANVGGHIVKDKLFYFGSFEHIKRDLPTIVTVPAATLTQLGLDPALSNAIPFGQDVYFYLGKADWQINSNNRLTGRFSYFRNESPFNNGGQLTLAPQTYLFKDRAPVYAFQLVSTVSPVAVNEFRFQSARRFQRQVAFDGTGLPPTINISSVANFGKSDQTDFSFTETTPEFSDSFSYNRKNHSYKFGGGMRWILDNQTSNVFARYTFPSIQAYLDAKSGVNTKSYSNYSQIFGDPKLEYNSIFSNLFVQDTWKLRPNITLTYGVRYDVYKIPSADSSALFSTSKSFSVDKNNFAPRVGLAWGLGKDQKTVIRVNGGIFYDAPQTNTYYRALLNNGRPQFFTLSTGPAAAFAPAFPNILSSLPTTFNRTIADIITVSPNFRSLYSSNANIQITRQLDTNTSLSVSYLFTKGTKLPIYRNINIAPTRTLLDGRGFYLKADNTLNFIDPAFSNVSTVESAANSSYNGLNATVNRRFAKGFNLLASYTWSHALDNAPESNVIDSGGQYPEDPSNLRRDHGNSLADRRHSFTLSTVLAPHVTLSNRVMNYIANNNQLSILLVARTGDVFNLGSNRSINGDPTVPNAQQRPLYVGRNTIVGQNVYQVDVRYSRSFTIRERWKPEVFGEFWNLFNHTNVTGVNTIANVDANGAITSFPANYLLTNGVLDPRLAQIGFRLSF